VRTAVEIVEVSPRDGLQNEAARVSTTDKLALVDVLVRSGLRRIEVTSFVDPRRVPQLADADEVCAALPVDAGVVWTGLVLNDRGLDRALAAGLREINVVVVCTDTFSLRNQGVDTAGGVAAWRRIAGAARAAGLRVTLTLAAAFGCPFEGAVSADRVRAVLAQCVEQPPDEVALADTIGVGVPPQVEALTRVATETAPGIGLRWHFHNTRNTGYANAWTATLAADPSLPLALDASAGGIGGCPFAPNATGNVATEDLVDMLERGGIETGVDVDALLPLAGWLGERLGKQVPGQLARAGRFPGR
jgi:hydroxymethylglutaryl-CoA lyase